MSYSFDSFNTVIEGLDLLSNESNLNCHLNSTQIRRTIELSEDTCEALVAGSKLLRRVVEEPVHQALELPNILGIDPEDARKILDYYVEQGFVEVFDHCGSQGRLYGSCVAILELKDNTDTTRPWNKPKDILDITILSRDEITVNKLSFPDLYSTNSIILGTNPKVYHKSRVLRFDGEVSYGTDRQLRRGMGQSVIEPCLPLFVQYRTALAAAAAMVKDYDVFVYKLKQLYQLLSKQNTSELTHRINQLMRSKSVTRGLLIDSDLEDVSYVTRNYTGLHEILDDLLRAFNATTDIPRSVLLSASDGNLFSENGLSDRYAMAKFVHKYQSRQFKPNHLKLFKIIGSVLGINTDGLAVQYNSTVQLTDKELMQLMFEASKTDSANKTTGVYDESIARQRYQTPSFQTSIRIPLDYEFKTQVNSPNVDYSGNHNGKEETSN